MNVGRKDKARELLSTRDHDGLINWARADRSALRILFSFTFDNDELIRWRAIEAAGKVAAVVAQSDINKVRDFIRRLLWLMNDESGGLGWHAPEVIGEILANVPDLIGEYGALLLHYLDEEPFEIGTHFAVYRLAGINPAPFANSVFSLGESLKNPDPTIRSYALLALRALRAKDFLPHILKLQEDGSPVALYDFETGQIKKTTIGEIAQGAVGSLGQPDVTT